MIRGLQARERQNQEASGAAESGSFRSGRIRKLWERQKLEALGAAETGSFGSGRDWKLWERQKLEALGAAETGSFGSGRNWMAREQKKSAQADSLVFKEEGRLNDFVGMV